MLKQKFKQTESGKIPKDWGILDLTDAGNLKTGSTPSTKVKDYWDGDIPWMTSGDVHQGLIIRTTGFISEKGMQNSNTILLPKKTIVIALNGQGKTRGTVGILGISTTCNQSIVGIIPNEHKIVPEYLYYNLQSRYSELRNLSGAEGRNGLNMKLLKTVKISTPPLIEQSHIASVLFCIDSAIQQTDEVIEQARKLKKGLMQELLTRGIGHKKFKETEFGE
ncbi:MAG: restriction endonuclease subunit S, partial [Candidatus ainarchaeum sp.]|nr:restriction endonuclease subunit S [Candidatus ainarchaeum sp.]